MPIYEFYCSSCHRVFSFLSRKVNTRKRPACPRCARKGLERKVSRFAVVSGRGESEEDNPFPDVDESKMEQAVESMAREADGVNDDDPRAVSRLMRRFYEQTGLPIGDGLQEALRRMEQGEDPQQIEEEIGDLLEQEEPLFGGGSDLRGMHRRIRPPTVDEGLYEL